MKSLNSCQSSQLSATMRVILATCVATSIGCQSMGKLNLLADKQIPVLTRNSDVELPPPSAAETPSPAVVETNSTPAPTSFATTNEPANGSAAAADDPYPATGYGTFPQQPESLSQSTTASPSAYPTPPGSPSTVATTAANLGSQPLAGSPQNVQQGPYATKAAPAGVSTPDSFATAAAPAIGMTAPAVTKPTNNSDFPVTTNLAASPAQPVVQETPWAQPAPAANSPWPSVSAPSSSSQPVAQSASPVPVTSGGNNFASPAMAAASSAAPTSDARDSSFGSTPSVTTSSNQLASASTFSSEPALNGVSPPASQIPAYIDNNQNGQTVSQASYESTAPSHYEQVATQPSANSAGGWRPGSTGRR